MRAVPSTLFALLAACASDDGASPPASVAAPTTAAPTSDAPTTAAPAAPVAAPVPTSAPAATGTRCKVRSAGLPEWQGACTFRLDGGGGSFVITPVGTPDFGGGIRTVSVGLDGSGAAEVRGLTAEGVNSRWGVATRSPTDRACWSGPDFEVCAWEGAAPDKGALATKDTAAGKDAAAKAVRPQYGGEYWVVYLAVADQGDAAELRAAEATLRALGFEMGGTMGSGQLNCDKGAAAALGRSEDAFGVSAWFASEADARTFAATLPRPAVGVARVSPGCAD